MAQKQQTHSRRPAPPEFGDLPREGYVYGLYRGHIIRLGLVILALLAILFWAWSGARVSVRSCLFPGGQADLTALSDDPAAAAPEALPTAEIPTASVYVQHGCYRLSLTPSEVRTAGESLYWLRAGEMTFLAAADAAPAVGTAVRAVFYPVPETLTESAEARGAAGWLADLRKLPVGQEKIDTAQMLIFTPVVLLMVIFWLLMLQKPSRHPVYRQLARYGRRVSDVVAEVDRDLATGVVISETRRATITPNWIIQKSAFNTIIYRNTGQYAGQEEGTT